MISRSEKSRTRKGSTSARVSGPPRFRRRTPTSPRPAIPYTVREKTGGLPFVPAKLVFKGVAPTPDPRFHKDISALLGTTDILPETFGGTQAGTSGHAAGQNNVVYTATGDTRPDAALVDLERCLRAGKDVVSTSFFPLLHPPSAPRSLLDGVEAACQAGDTSVFVSGIDPGWALDILPALLSGVGAGITEIRVQEVFNYSLYDQPDVVRQIIGFGQPIDELPLMLHDFSL